MTATVVKETKTDLEPLPSGGPVRVTVRVVASGDPGKKPWAFVVVRCLPGAHWWSCPNATTLRRLVDEATKDTGLRRDGARFDGQHTNTLWRFHYPLKEM